MKKWASVVLFVVALGGLIGWSQLGSEPLPEGTRADRVRVHKAARTLELWRGDELLRAYHVSLGRHPVGHKQREGDGRTPEGHYVLDYRKPDSSFHRALHISYPSPADVASAKARNVSPGGLIMVHGLRNDLGFLGRLHRLRDWTDGCIAVTNREIDEISRVVPDGTPIDIEP
jgi:murein L,D-transpeptidase YafK